MTPLENLASKEFISSEELHVAGMDKRAGLERRIRLRREGDQRDSHTVLAGAIHGNTVALAGLVSSTGELAKTIARHSDEIAAVQQKILTAREAQDTRDKNELEDQGLLDDQRASYHTWLWIAMWIILACEIGAVLYFIADFVNVMYPPPPSFPQNQ